MEKKNKFSLNKETLQILYSEYKDYLLPYAIIVASALIVFFLIVPQIQQYSEQKAKLDTEKQKLEVIKNNFNFLSGLDEATLDSNLKILSNTLPPTKDFAAVINSISYVSSKTGVSVGDFGFEVGDVSIKQNGKSPLTATPVVDSTFPTFQIAINLNGSVNSIMKFIEELYKTVPLSEVSSLKITGNTADLTTLFYYRTYPPINVSDEDPVTPLSSKAQTLISDLSSWGNASGADASLLSQTQSASQSAAVSTSPF